MNLQQPSKPSANGFGRRRGDRDLGSRADNNFHSGKSNANKLTNNNAIPGGKSVVCDSPSHDRLVYLATCLIGHHVEVQVKNGSKYTGIFHATNAEKDFGIILKMAHLSKDATLRGHKFAESLNKGPSKTLIIPAEELVQVLAKDVSITRDGLMNDIRHEKLHELMLDSSITQSRHVEVERELKPWVPDEDDLRYPELDNIFDGHWNRNWDQFERNETLFGVKSTYDEELYTTKLEKGPQMKALETEALRIAKEIEGEETQDLHLAEERGFDLHSKFDIDEETRFSSVGRGLGVVGDDSGYEEDTDIFLDSHNMETFGESFHSEAKGSTDLTFGKGNDRDGPSSISSSLDHAQSSESKIVVDVCRSSSDENARQLASDPSPRSFSTLESENRIPENAPDGRKSASELTDKSRQVAGDNQLTKPEDFQSSDGVPDKGLFPITSFGANVSLTNNEKHTSTTSPPESSLYSKPNGETQTASSRLRPGSSASSNSDGAAAASVSGRPGLSPSSSVGSLASEKSTLNPHAKEFKLNPNAKSFVPSQTPIRPQSPLSDGAFYYQNNMPAVPHIHGMPFGVGVGPGFAGHQPVIFNPPVAPIPPPQAYFQPNGPQYGQQMLLGQPRQLVYMQGYQPLQEMPYKGRDY